MNTDYRPQVRRVLLLTLLLNLFVLGLKAGLGWWTGSLSLLADALHSVTDSTSNILGVFTSQLSSPYPDRDHPYGHQKFEALGAMGIAAFLAIACFEILKGAIDRLLFAAGTVKMSPPVLWLMLVVLGVNICVAWYERREGERIGSKILIADAFHTMSDIWISMTVIAGLIGVWLGYQWLDVVFAFPVAILVFRSGWEVLQQNIPWVVDEMAIAPETIRDLVLQVPGVVNCHDIASRGLVGRQVFIEMHLIVAAEDVETAHKITEAVEAELEVRYSPVRVLIHVEPPDYESERIGYESSGER
ncbi:MAG: cation transporter [Cyanobacteria bacterium J055]|nr:MAG: cation transporter [Cyanobacteria bacterium J055]